MGPVVKKDVMKASVMLEHEDKYAVILAFDVKVERDAQELADSTGVKIFTVGKKLCMISFELSLIKCSHFSRRTSFTTCSTASWTTLRN